MSDGRDRSSIALNLKIEAIGTANLVSTAKLNRKVARVTHDAEFTQLFRVKFTLLSQLSKYLGFIDTFMSKKSKDRLGDPVL